MWTRKKRLSLEEEDRITEAYYMAWTTTGAVTPPDHLAIELSDRFDPIRCPAGVYNNYEDIRGCGSYNVDGPDDEGFYDCRDCGLCFQPGGPIKEE